VSTVMNLRVSWRKQGVVWQTEWLSAIQKYPEPWSEWVGKPGCC
jgi:hypothetical protein